VHEEISNGAYDVIMLCSIPRSAAVAYFNDKAGVSTSHRGGGSFISSALSLPALHIARSRSTYCRVVSVDPSQGVMGRKGEPLPVGVVFVMMEVDNVNADCVVSCEKQCIFRIFSAISAGSARKVASRCTKNVLRTSEHNASWRQD
jgi:hypothetical protein